MGAATAPRGSAPQPVLMGDPWRYMERNVRASAGGRAPEGETASRVRLRLHRDTERFCLEAGWGEGSAEPLHIDLPEELGVTDTQQVGHNGCHAGLFTRFDLCIHRSNQVVQGRIHDRAGYPCSFGSHDVIMSCGHAVLLCAILARAPSSGCASHLGSPSLTRASPILTTACMMVPSGCGTRCSSWASKPCVRQSRRVATPGTTRYGVTR